LHNLTDELRERYKPKQEFQGVWLATYVEFLEDEYSIWRTTIGSFEKFGYDEQGIWIKLDAARSDSTELCIDWSSIRSITEDPTHHSFVLHLEIAFLIDVKPQVLPVQLLKECYRRGKFIGAEQYSLRPMVFDTKNRNLALLSCWLITAFIFSHVFASDTTWLGQLEKEGMFVAATVHESAPLPEKNNMTYFTYSYKVGEKNYKGSTGSEYKNGQEIQIRYLPSCPDISFPGNNAEIEARRSSEAFFSFFVGCCMFPTMITIMFAIALWNSKSYYREAELANMELSKVERLKQEDVPKIEEFTDFEGSEIKDVAKLEEIPRPEGVEAKKLAELQEVAEPEEVPDLTDFLRTE
jgi:hypothetical protein